MSHDMFLTTIKVFVLCYFYIDWLNLARKSVKFVPDQYVLLIFFFQFCGVEVGWKKERGVGCNAQSPAYLYWKNNLYGEHRV